MLFEARAAAAGPPDTDVGRDTTIRRYAVRRNILTAAKQRFARRGYEHVTLQQIARDAGMDWRDFVVYFRDKRALLTAVLDDAWDDLLPRLNDIMSGSITAHSALLSMFAFMTNALHKDEELGCLLLFEGRRSNPEAGEIGLSGGYHRFMQVCRDLVARGQRDGSFRSTYHPSVAASMLVGALEGMLRDRLIATQERSTTPYNGTYLMQAFDALVTSLKN